MQTSGRGCSTGSASDLDDNLREMGVGDLKVPKQMRQLGEAFYGRSRPIARPWPATDDAMLVAALGKEYLRQERRSGRARPPRLADYMRAGVADLGAQPMARSPAASFAFREPAKILGIDDQVNEPD